MMALPDSLASPPPPVPNTIITIPKPHVLLITLNRPDQLNAIPIPQHAAFENLYRWYDDEPWLRCAVLTGAGRAFCAGADLKEWDHRNSVRSGTESSSSKAPPDRWALGGFGGLSNRPGRKPIIAAVNGLCLGGGMEMVINCDLVVAAADAKFALPEVTIGVVAIGGALARLVRTVGRQRASEMALVGGTYSAEQMREWGLVNKVVAKLEVVKEALGYADAIAGNSPDAVMVSREGLKLGWDGLSPDVSTELLRQGMYGRMDYGENMREGVRSFIEKRKPVWKDSKL